MKSHLTSILIRFFVKEDNLYIFLHIKLKSTFFRKHINNYDNSRSNLNFLLTLIMHIS